MFSTIGKNGKRSSIWPEKTESSVVHAIMHENFEFVNLSLNNEKTTFCLKKTSRKFLTVT